MENSTYVGLSAQSALWTKMNIIANNVANMNTPGYRAQNMIFQEYIDKPPRTSDGISFVLDRGQYQMTDAGPIKQTGGALDVALVGPGFFGVEAPDGSIQYSRAGNFTMTAQGELVNSTGLKVVGQSGGAITIPRDAENIYIDKKGRISTDTSQVGQLMVVEFQDSQKLNPTGNGLYETDEAPIPSEKTTVLQGSIEGSNVQPIVEMTRMIDVSREYQAVQNMIKSEHDRLRTMIQRLSRASS